MGLPDRMLLPDLSFPLPYRCQGSTGSPTASMRRAMPALRVAKAGHSHGRAVSSSNLQHEVDRGACLWVLWQQGRPMPRK